jgi:hypothetical protein
MPARHQVCACLASIFQAGGCGVENAVGQMLKSCAFARFSACRAMTCGRKQRSPYESCPQSTDSARLPGIRQFENSNWLIVPGISHQFSVQVRRF